jgi:hypothetical protein
MPAHPQTLLFIHLVELDILFRDDTDAKSLFDLISVIHAPNLSCIMFFAPSTNYLRCLLQFSDMLVNVRELTLHILNVDGPAMHKFLSHTPNVVLLDILQSDSEVLAAMCITSKPVTAASPPETFVCPLLSTLGVKEAEFWEVRDFMEARWSVQQNMERVMFRRSLSPEDGDDDEELHLDWIEEHAIVCEGISFRDPFWLNSEVKCMDL